MAAWPELDELKQRLDVESNDWDGDDGYDGDVTRLSRALADAIAWTKTKVGLWDEYEDEPDATVAQVALERAIHMAGGQVPIDNNGRPLYEGDLIGHRRSFGIS
jgi:hypothetical protein